MFLYNSFGYKDTGILLILAVLKFNAAAGIQKGFFSFVEGPDPAGVFCTESRHILISSGNSLDIFPAVYYSELEIARLVRKHSYFSSIFNSSSYSIIVKDTKETIFAIQVVKDNGKQYFVVKNELLKYKIYTVAAQLIYYYKFYKK